METIRTENETTKRKPKYTSHPPQYSAAIKRTNKTTFLFVMSLKENVLFIQYEKIMQNKNIRIKDIYNYMDVSFAENQEANTKSICLF